MNIIGIDYSLNSPGICILKNNEYSFISFFNDNGREWDRSEKPYSGFLWHNKLLQNSAIKCIPYTRIINSDSFIEKQREKLIDSKNIAKVIINTIKNNGLKNTHIGLEGFAYGAKGNSFIDIVGYNTFLRNEIMNEFGTENIFIFPPSQVKRITGKGNANKHYMVNAFQKNVLNDSILENNKFWQLIQKEDFSKTIPKPIDDLIDSYFIVRALSSHLNSNN